MMQPIFTFFCPVFVTGGTEAIHQASMVFNRLGARSQIAYYGAGMQLNRMGNEVLCIGAGENICLDAFEAYAPVVATRIDLDPRNVIVAPEINAFEYQYFEPSRFVVWWLSVDNGLAHNPTLSDEATRSAFFSIPTLGHWFQSDYARRFLLSCGANSMQQLTDFTDATFVSPRPARPNDGSKILYNKKKGADLADRFFAANPDFEPLPLDGMTKAQLAETYRSHAVYVDFGTLPGKDRMPREAAACGCTVFVHRRGAGSELGDFPIADAFRFDAGEIESGTLAARIRNVLADCEASFTAQAHFRDVVAREHVAFTQEAQFILDAEAQRAVPPTVSGVEKEPAHRSRIAFAEGWDLARHRYCLWCVTPDNYVHVQAFDEIMQGLSEAFASLGGSAPITRHPSQWAGRVPIIFGGHLLPADAADRLPADSILFNLEQVDGRSDWLKADYLALLQRFAVLDYSSRNTAALVALGITHVRHLPIGTMPGLRRIIHAETKDVDVLFYGSLNERRAKIIDALRARGLQVEHLFGVYGTHRDTAVARAKVVLNLHFYDAAIFESVRVSYLLENGCCVVTEGDEADPDLALLRGAMAVGAYETLVERCVELAGDGPRRAAMAAECQRLMSTCRQSDLLAALFADSSSYRVGASAAA